MTHRNTWKASEREAAALFGARRQVLSGSSGRDDRTASDSTHERLFIETKYRASTAVRALWEHTKALAKKEEKTPVLAIRDKGKQGLLLVVHADDLETMIDEYLQAKGETNGKVLPASAERD